MLVRVTFHVPILVRQCFRAVRIIARLCSWQPEGKSNESELTHCGRSTHRASTHAGKASSTTEAAKLGYGTICNRTFPAWHAANGTRCTRESPCVCASSPYERHFEEDKLKTRCDGPFVYQIANCTVTTSSAQCEVHNCASKHRSGS